MSVLDCFQETASTLDPVYRNFIDPLLYGRSTGQDMPAAFDAQLGPAQPSGTAMGLELTQPQPACLSPA